MFDQSLMLNLFQDFVIFFVILVLVDGIQATSVENEAEIKLISEGDKCGVAIKVCKFKVGVCKFELRVCRIEVGVLEFEEVGPRDRVEMSKFEVATIKFEDRAKPFCCVSNIFVGYRLS